MTTDSTPAGPPSSAGEAAPAPPLSPIFSSMFVGPNGIRAGWRLLIYLLLLVAAYTGLRWGVGHITPLRNYLNSRNPGVLTAGPEAVSEVLVFLVVLIPAMIMSKIEKRAFDEYGLPASEAFGKRFWLGLPYGFAMMTLLMGFIAAFHGGFISGIGATGAVALKFAIFYGICFLFTGFFEEFGFRGYSQYTLASGIGFWPSAIILSILFGAIHLGNPGEAKTGAFMAGSFGLLAAFSLQRTGSIWFAVGMHAGFDWTETFFYGVPDSGLLAEGHFLNSTFHGPNWLTGGSVGPEGSVFAFVVLGLAAVGIHFMFPARSRAA